MKARVIVVEGNCQKLRYMGLKWKKDFRNTLKSLVLGLKAQLNRRYVDPNGFENIQKFLALDLSLELILAGSL